MEKSQELNSQVVLDSIPQFENISFDDNVMNDFYEKVENEMKEFDIQKNQRIAHSAEDLMTLIITT